MTNEELIGQEVQVVRATGRGKWRTRLQDGGVGGGCGALRRQLDAEEAHLLAGKARALLHRAAGGERRLARAKLNLCAILVGQQ